jgi:hypothetical protein
MNPFPGVAPLTVNTIGTGSPGVLVTSGAADPHGSWPTPIEATGNDSRTAANLMAAVESLTDRTNWNAWRTIDVIAGGDYRSLFQAQVFLANILEIDRSALHGGGVTTLTVFGDADGGTALLAQATSANGNGALTQGNGTGYGLQASGGASQSGAKATAGSGSKKNGIEGTGDGTDWWVGGGSWGVTATGGVEITNGPLYRRGTNCYEVMREANLPFAVDSNGSFDPSTTGDTVLYAVPALTANRTWTLNHPASGGAVEFMLMATGAFGGGGFTLSIIDQSTAVLVAPINGFIQTRFRYSPAQGQWRVLNGL